MTVTATTTYSELVGNGSATAFPFTFAAASADEVKVSVASIVQSGGYTVTLSASGTGGTVTFDTAPAASAAILIESDPDFTMETAFANEGSFNPATFDRVHDRLTSYALWLRARVSALFPSTLATLPADRAGKFVGYDAEGDAALLSGTGNDTAFRTDIAAAGGTALIGYKNPLGGPAILRLLRSRLGETVSALDYVQGNGSANDHDAYTALLALGPAEIAYPPNCEIATSSQVLLPGDMTHRFYGDAGITADVADFGVRGLGYPDLLVLAAASTISRGATSFDATTSPAAAGLARGDDFYIYDTSSQEYDINQVRLVSGNTVYTKRPINYTFGNSANIRIYKLANACRNVKIFDGTIRNPNASLSAGGLSFLNATDIMLDGVTVRDTGGIGGEMNLSMRWLARNITAINTGGVGFSGRNTKDFQLLGFLGRYPNRDEALTFYKNCTHGEARDIDIEQYLSGEHPAGNVGAAGNCVLVDDRGTDIRFGGMRLRGSATFSFFVTNNSDRITIDDFDIAQANLGGIRFGPGCNSGRVGRGIITDIISAPDTEQAVQASTTGSIAGTTLTVSSGTGIVAGLAVTGSGVTAGTLVVSGSGTSWVVSISQTVASTGLAFYLPTAAIQDEAGTTGNVLGADVQFARVAGAVNVRQRGTPGTVSCYGNTDMQGAVSVSATSLPSYADNAAAITGGLAVGRLYRTATGTIMQRY